MSWEEVEAAYDLYVDAEDAGVEAADAIAAARHALPAALAGHALQEETTKTTVAAIATLGTNAEHESFVAAAATSAVPRGRRCLFCLRVVHREEPFSIHGHSLSTGV